MGKTETCPFCRAEGYLQGEYCIARFDKFSVSPGHTLIIPKRHTPTWFDMSADEHSDAMQLIAAIKGYLDKEFMPDGYNIGMNCGPNAGQTIGHAHIHIIP